MPDCVVRKLRFKSHCRQLCLARQPLRYTALGHGLHALTALPRSTQPSTLHGMVNWVSAFGLSITNKCGWYQPIGRLTGQVGWLGLRVGSHLALSLHSSNEPGELSQWSRLDDSTINIVIGIGIIRLHRSTTYVDTAYCYRLSSVVCLFVCHTSEPCKKQLNQLKCRLGWRLYWAQGTMC